MALDQARRGVQQEQREGPVGLDEVERAFQGPIGGLLVTERVPGNRLQQEGVSQPDPREYERGATKDRRERGDRRVRVVLGEPEHSGGDARRSVPAVLAAEFGKGLLGALVIAEAHQDVHQQRPCPGNGVVRGSESPGQRFGALQRSQRVGVPSARQLEKPADVADNVSGCGLGVSGEGALSALDPRFGLVQPSPPRQHGSQRHVGGGSCRVAGPAVSFGQHDRLLAELGRPRIRLEHLDRRQMRQAGELQKRPPDPACQRDAPLQVSLCLREPARPDVGDTVAGLPRWRTIPSSSCAWARRTPDTEAVPRSASPRYRSAASSDPYASSSAAATAASSESTARTPDEYPASNSWVMAACPSRCRPGQ
jgi:hypothetical protein